MTATSEADPTRGLLHLRSPAETARRLPQVVIGLVLFGVGIRCMISGDLGLGPWDVFHRSVASRSGLSLGTVIMLTGVVVVLGFVPLRERLGLGTLLNAIVIGVAADASAPFIEPASELWARVGLMILGPIVIAFGTGLYLGGGLGPGPRDGIMTGLAKRGIPVWKARTAIEVTVLIVGLALDPELLDGGVFDTDLNAGTLWFAFGIGPMIQFFLPKLRMRDRGD